MLARRLQCRHNINTTLFQCLVLAEITCAEIVTFPCHQTWARALALTDNTRWNPHRRPSPEQCSSDPVSGLLYSRLITPITNKSRPKLPGSSELYANKNENIYKPARRLRLHKPRKLVEYMYVCGWFVWVCLIRLCHQWSLAGLAKVLYPTKIWITTACREMVSWLFTYVMGIWLV